ncbi:MAG: inosine-5-monophosphate dehydrogenase [Betaproteobacteria bacterium RIFCSPLOWO2_12_FULL_68_19]|nr:MAG: inosine-5-monophosphate dehydrogenase [Betaproteobacteria bacterium RIFCSPLOWO2_12_FULL_68_19]
MPERPIREVIGNQEPFTASADITVDAAARLMKRHRIGALLVIDGGRLAGIFTERDALFRVMAEGRDPAKTRIAEVMTVNPRTISPDRPFGHALHLMYEGEFRHVPVVEDGRALGMVSTRDALEPDLRQFIADLETRTHIGEILG